MFQEDHDRARWHFRLRWVTSQQNKFQLTESYEHYLGGIRDDVKIQPEIILLSHGHVVANNFHRCKKIQV